MSESLFKPFNPAEFYGMFGYAGQCCDIAIRRDDPAQAEECWRRGWMDAETRTLIGTVIDDCDRRAPKVAAKLRELGPVQREPEMVPGAA
jgi:hypothetical protein